MNLSPGTVNFAFEQDQETTVAFAAWFLLDLPLLWGVLLGFVVAAVSRQ